MKTDEFEFAFSRFLESPAYDEAEDNLFSVVRMAFIAGWEAARGEAPEPRENLIYLLHKKTDEQGDI